MKTFYKYLAGLLGLITVLSGCHFTDLQIEENPASNNSNGEKVTVYFNCLTPEEASGIRKAYADINFNSYHYDLYAKESGAQEFSKLNNERLNYSALYNGTEISPKVYYFQIKAYDENNNAVMAGASGSIDLVSGYKHVDFVMRPQTGFTGSAEITVDFPYDPSVAKMETCLTTLEAPFTPTQNQAKTITEFKASSEHAGFKQTVLNYEGLPSGSEVFVYIRILDSVNKVLSTRLEAVEITGGAVSKSKIYISKLRTYTVSLPLKKDGIPGLFVGKEIILIDKEGNKYVLTDDGNGNFTGSVADGEYDIYMGDKGEAGSRIDTGLDFVVGSDSNVNEVNFVTVTLPGDKGLHYSPVTGGGIPVPVGANGKHEKNEEGNYDFLVPAGGNLKVNVGYEEGFEGNGSGVTIGGSPVTPAVSGATPVQPDNTLTIPVPRDGTKPDVTVSGVSAVSYSVTYASGQYKFKDGYTPVSSYTALSGAQLPKYTDVEYLADGGLILDGWQNTSDSSKVYADIPKGTSGNIELKPVWKKGVAVTQPAEWVEEHPEVPGNFKVAPSVFACGYSLIIKWSDEINGTGETNIYIDYNSNGTVDAEDLMVSGSYNPSSTDFTGYRLKAENADGTKPASNFTYNVLGGKLASLTGLGWDAQNTSVVNISGKNTVIGNGVDVGIDLPSLTNEWVNITGEMSGDYHITLETRHEFNRNEKTHKVAYIQNSTFAQTSKFTCIKQDTKKELGLGFSNITENGTDKIIIYLKDPSPIHLPTEEEIKDEGGLKVFVWNGNEGAIPMEFMLGTTASINEKSSVFSISVKNGKFKLTETAIKKDDGTPLTTLNLGQTEADKYSESLSKSDSYIYLHMFSQDNMISAARSTEFLRSIYFIKDSADKEMEITLNLESVPYSEISRMQSQYGTSKFNYYNGSFYLGIKLPNNGTIFWHDSYNLAKQQVFNGMNGYLINITSKVENEYIFNRMKLGQCWTGGARYDGRNVFDTPTIEAPSKVTLDTAFKWQSGPEAGVTYTDGSICKVNGKEVVSGVYFSASYGSSGTLTKKTYYVTTTENASVLENSDVDFYNSSWVKIGTGKAGSYNATKKQLALTQAPSMKSGYSTTSIKYVAAKDLVLKDKTEPADNGYGNYHADFWAEYTNWNSGEPNDSNKGKSEQCMHFMNNGTWNDYSTDYGSVYGYIVEFTPYENQWNKEKANYPSMKSQMSY